jgi:hypothetical protein
MLALSIASWRAQASLSKCAGLARIDWSDAPIALRSSSACASLASSSSERKVRSSPYKVIGVAFSIIMVSCT